ncbi:MAG TPA: pitrilysin family protein [Candidatus Saccharimonadales bacterium]|nr:pitrilysin family protein [Candidatus Saccharimonadales bacterium]
MKHTVSEIILKNGARGLLIHIPHASVMTFDFNFRAGEYLVDPKKWEVPHLMEHVLLGANELIPKARDFQAELEKNGAYSNATTSVYDITYEAECADFEWDRVLGLLLVAITKPLFLEEEFIAEFGNVQEEMAARANNHFRRLSLEMRKHLGMLVKTDAERLALMPNVSVKDVREHYERTHSAANLRFVIAGNLTARRSEAVQNLIANIDLPAKGKRFILPNEIPRRLESPVYVHNETVENLYFYLDTFMRRRMSDPEIDALNLINTMLTETLYSRILGTARERGLVYGMNSGLAQTKNASNWWFGAQVSDKNAPALFNIIVHELEKVMEGQVDEEEIETTKQYALGRFQRSAQTVGGTAAGYAGRYFFDEVVENYYQIPARINAIEKDQIINIARALFADNIWGFGVLGGTGEQFTHELFNLVAPLWSHELVKA